MDEINAKQLNDEGRDLWNNKAQFWDDLHGADGNAFHRTLVSPSVERLLALKAGERVLDIGCGTGVLARRLQELGGVVTACDFSEELIKIAQQYETTQVIDYRVIDATDEDALLSLGVGQFDAITCTMALMDMPVIAPMYRAVGQLLKADGRFVLANIHPAFNSNHPVFMLEMDDVDGVIRYIRSIKISRYLEIPPQKGAGAENEPNPHYYYHRPLQQLLGEAFEAGLVLDGIDEPAFTKDMAEAKTGVGWSRLWQIPAVLTCRLRIV